MDAYCVSPEELPALDIERLGPATVDSPLTARRRRFTEDDERVSVYTHSHTLRALHSGGEIPTFEVAGPRRKLFFQPRTLRCGIVTCGGLCPGLNDVIRTVTLALIWQYAVEKVYGFRYGYAGLTANPPAPPMELTPEVVDDIHLQGGDILGSSRGPQDENEMVDTLERMGISLLFVVGGDGTMRGARALAGAVKRRGAAVAVIGIPKTIDNDISGIEQSFGFSTAVEACRAAIHSAHQEARGAWNGVGLVKLMGRESGFIAAQATLANSDVNFCFVPEAPPVLDGPGGFLEALERRLDVKHHAVVVVAEGVGETLAGQKGDVRLDISGNAVREDIGPLLHRWMVEHFKAVGKPISVKYIDPSYMIRSLPADSNDSAFCLMLGQNAVHAGMSGRTDMVIGYWNQYYVHIPIDLATLKRKKLDPRGDVWQTVLETTGQLRWS